MKKIKIIVLLTLVALAALSAWVDFSIWQIQHPGAPTWTYLFAN
jgi:Flp pilus assembly protein CpaB